MSTDTHSSAYLLYMCVVHERVQSPWIKEHAEHKGYYLLFLKKALLQYLLSKGHGTELNVCCFMFTTTTEHDSGPCSTYPIVRMQRFKQQEIKILPCCSPFTANNARQNKQQQHSNPDVIIKLRIIFRDYRNKDTTVISIYSFSLRLNEIS